MSVGPLVLELIVVFCLALFLLHRYGNITKHHPVATFATLTAWYFSLIIIFILPLDVSSTFYRQCVILSKQIDTREVTVPINQTGLVENVMNKTSGGNVSAPFQVPENSSVSKNTSADTCEMPWSYVPRYTLPIMWRIVYWTSQFLTWLLLPFMQSYIWSGHFTALGKIKHALIKNVVYYGSYLLIFFALLIYVAANPSIKLNFSQLKVICITAANTWGLFLLVLLLGYGLVEVPRSVWRASNPMLTMAYVHFKLAKLSTEKQEAIENMEDLLVKVKSLSESIRYNHPFRKNVNIIISKCPPEFQDEISQQGMVDFEEYDDGRRRDSTTENSLVRLHLQIIQASQMKARTSIQWKMLMDHAMHLDNVVKNMKQIIRSWVEELPANDRPNSPKLKWYWECIFKLYLLKISAVCLVILSLVVIWSECTFFNEDPVLSIFAIFINLAKRNYNYFYIELASCFSISYLCVCAYYTIFRIKFFNIYYIAGHHQTDEPSLMFVGIMLCRLTAPLCLNFLGLIHLDTHITSDASDETSYTQIMGHLDVIPIISKGFNIYFPILVVVLCFATYFSLGQRCLSAIGFQQFVDGDLEDDFTADLVEEGRQLVNREKRKQEREIKIKNRSTTGNDISTRQWQGRTMRDAEMSKTSKNVINNDKVDLLSDTEPIDYSSITDGPSIAGGNSYKSDNWSSGGSRWSSHRSASKRPPQNIFDDI